MTEITFDPAKSERNCATRGFGFELVVEFDFHSAFIWIDDRRDYGETRFVALGLIGQRLYALVYVEVPNGIRVISFRKANDREVFHYGRQRS